LREVTLVNQLANPLLAQIIVALVHRDLINPGEQRAAKIEVFDRKIDLRENLLRNVLGVVAVAQDAEYDRKHLGLVAFHHFAECQFVPRLDAPNQGRLFAIPVVHSRLGSRLRSNRRELQCAGQSSHAT